jgi:hypothetical protein
MRLQDLRPWSAFDRDIRSTRLDQPHSAPTQPASACVGLCLVTPILMLRLGIGPTQSSDDAMQTSCSSLRRLAFSPMSPVMTRERLARAQSASSTFPSAPSFLVVRIGIPHQASSPQHAASTCLGGNDSLGPLRLSLRQRRSVPLVRSRLSRTSLVPTRPLMFARAQSILLARTMSRRSWVLSSAGRPTANSGSSRTSQAVSRALIIRPSSIKQSTPMKRSARSTPKSN